MVRALRPAVALLLPLGAAIACGRVLGIHPLGEPPDSSDDGGTLEDGAEEDGGAVLVDPSWAQWPMPNAPAPSGVPNAARCVVDPDAGTVTDQITQLVWQQTPTDSSGDPLPAANQPQAVSYCAELRLAGFDDWRLPTLIELESIVDYSKAPASNPVWFPDTGYDIGYWSSNGGGASFWDIYFAYGNAGVNVGDTLTNYYRCVRGGPAAPPFAPPGPAPASRYKASDAGTVLDTKTKLTWQQQPSSTTMSESQAIAFCAGSSLNGTGWRVPTLSEMMTLYDYPGGGDLDSPVFANPNDDNTFWSSTVVAEATGTWWVVRGGYSDYHGTSTENFVRCVR
jgi:hypothetical protein